MSANFPGPPHTMGFVAFSRAMGNWWENPCISHVLKYIIGWESDGKKVPILLEKYDYQFPRFSPYNGFCYIFPYYGKLMGKPMRFPYDEVYHKMGIGWEKITHTMGKVWLPISQFSLYDGFCCIFPCCGKLTGNPMYFPYDEIRYFFPVREFPELRMQNFQAIIFIALNIKRLF